MSSTTPDAARILEIATGYMAAKQLFEASRIGLFTALSHGASTVEEVAAATSTPVSTTRILADAMAAKGLLTRSEGRYALSSDAAAYLTGGDAVIDLAPFLRFLSEISYPHWLQFGHTVDTGEPGDLQMDEARWSTFMAGVMTYNRLHGQEFARLVDLSAARNALDFGGLSPEFAIGAMQANPQLRTTFIYASDLGSGLDERLQESGLAARSTVASGDTVSTEPAGSFDAIYANHVVHRFTPAENRQILTHLRAAAAADATLTLLDFFLDSDEQQRALDALHAGEYLVIDGTVVYPEDTVRQWLVETGWTVRDKIALPGSPRVLVATAA